jgi:alanyl-tRNA synthetase
VTVAEIRQKYLDFFRARGHHIVPSARLVPENDPTTLFTGSGMQPMLPYFLGAPHPQGTRIADSQKAFRAGDIEEIGDNRHTTLFEMLGNWSFGDYFKDEQIPWMHEFLTKELNLDPTRLYFTCYDGNEALGIPRDTQSYELWKSLGVPDNRISYYGDTKNWWSRVGEPANMPDGEPGGPDTEMFYDFGTPHNPAFGAACHPNCDCGRFVEIGNNVFMEYVKRDGKFEKLPKPNVDFGGGLERLATAVRDNSDIFLIDTIQPTIVELAAASGKNYNDSQYQKSFRIVADHIRAATFMAGDGVTPSNTDQGYVLRRLIRRAVRHLDRLGVGEGELAKISELIINAYSAQYPELSAARLDIHNALREEEQRFRKTLATGLKEFEKYAERGGINGPAAFMLFTTFGFPIELTEEIALERGIPFDLIGFKTAFQLEMQKHQNTSRAGAGQKFAGGLADHQEQTVRYHTTHHLLLKALQMVLGPEVHQRGSNITSERLRIDFSAPSKMTKEQIAEVEEIVNKKIAEGIDVIRTDMPKEQAEKLGAEHEFGVKYPETVSVYTVGLLNAPFSIEFCGGPHVSNTSEIGRGGKKFKILKEEAVAAGIRRIKAVVL